VKIGVIGHTHQLTSVDDLPARAKLALTEVDLVLHVGNVGSLSFLRSLQDAFALTFAVYGQLDNDDVRRYLEADKIVEFANRRIAMLFDPNTVDSSKLRGLKRQTAKPEAVAEQLLTRFDNVDCVLFGCPGKSFSQIYQGILILNPGQITVDNGGNGSMGVLEITERAITGRVLHI
jgi:putative phosphoesterase